MKEKLKLLIFDIIYNKIGLKQIEEEFNNHSINKKEIDNPNNLKVTSEYFFLKNDIYLERLTSDEIEFISLLIDSKDIDDNERLKKYLEKNLLKLLLPDTDEKYLNYDYDNYNEMVPSDAIVLAFHTIDYNDGYDEQKQQFINDKLNYIQDILGPQNDLKVSVIKYNEIPYNEFKEL